MKKKNPYYKLIYNTGFIGEGKYRVSKNKKLNKPYSTWFDILRRCYKQDIREKDISYKNTTVCVEWHNFQNFAKWFEDNYIEGFQLDKDILIKGNKIYSPETCCFVPQEINKLFTKRLSKRGLYPIGVSLINGRIIAQYRANNIGYYLGTFDTPEEAFQAYKVAKEQHIKEVANKWRGQITERCYQAMYNYQVEITD